MRTRRDIFRVIDSLAKIVVATIVVTGAELTIRWNDIEGVHSTSTAGQLIPLLIGIGVMVRVFYKALTSDGEEGFYEGEPMGRFDQLMGPYHLPIVGGAPEGENYDFWGCFPAGPR